MKIEVESVQLSEMDAMIILMALRSLKKQQSSEEYNLVIKAVENKINKAFLEY